MFRPPQMASALCRGRLLALLACLLAATGLAASLPAPAARLNRSLPGLGYSPGNILALQICLDRRGFSCNTIDGQCGRKTQVALATWCSLNGKEYSPGLENKAWELYFAAEPRLFTAVVVTAQHHAALTPIPADPADKARLPSMGFETICEMFAELGHCSQTLLRNINPGVSWPNPPAGMALVVPYCVPAQWHDAPMPPRFPYGKADVLRVSLSRMEVTVFDEEGRLIALLPCSIAAAKNKLPPPGEIEVKTLVRNPNYTYTPDVAITGHRSRHIFPPGPNNPVGTAWIGLSLPTYGIHGTPYPERIGHAESHGCFRLANWNAEKLRTMCEVGTSIVIEQ